MTRLEHRTLILERTPPAECSQCHRLAELRPYGPGGASICLACVHASPENYVRAVSAVLRLAAGADRLEVRP
jgi:hypothetical protein